MAFKKAIGQTMRELKREVNKYRLSEIEIKTQEATSNEAWGPHGSLLSTIAEASFNSNDAQLIMATLDKRLVDTGKDWRHVYKAITVMEFLGANGSMEIVEEIIRRVSLLMPLTDFQFVEEGGKDQGINVRKKAESLICLLSDREILSEVRTKAAANKNKYQGVGSTTPERLSGSKVDDDDWQKMGWPKPQSVSRPPPPSYEEAMKTSLPFDEETYLRLNKQAARTDSQKAGMKPSQFEDNSASRSSLAFHNKQQSMRSASLFDNNQATKTAERASSPNRNSQRPSFDFDDFDPRVDASCTGCESASSSSYGPPLQPSSTNPTSSSISNFAVPAQTLPSLQGSSDKLIGGPKGRNDLT